MQKDRTARRALTLHPGDNVTQVTPDTIQADVYRQFAERAGRNFLTSLQALPEYKPRPGVDLGLLQVTVTVVGSTVDLGSVPIDPVNLGDLANVTARRAEGLRTKHARLAAAPAGRPTLRLVGGER